MRVLSLSAVVLLAGCAGAAPSSPNPPSPPVTAAAAAPCPEIAPVPGPPVRFVVSRPADPAGKPVSGRVIVLMSSHADKVPFLAPMSNGGLDPALASEAVEGLAPGESFELDPDKLAFPKPLSQLPQGTYQLMAVLDTDGSYPRSGLGEGDLRSAVVEKTFDPAHAGKIELRLDSTVPASTLPAVEGVTAVKLESPLLSAFHGRPITMEALVVLPPRKEPAKKLPTAYLIPGFGATDVGLWKRAKILREAMTAAPWNQMAFVWLKGDVPTGHHVFADSVNTGPWGRALVEELIPHLEKRFSLVAKAEGRFVGGHSSGGWASLWLQITHPTFFGGTWSTSPDPVDFRSFTGVDITPGSTDNAFVTKDGKARNLWRDGDKEVLSFQQFVKLEDVEGRDGGVFSTFDWVFSPRGPDGKPLRLVDRRTGAVSPEVQQAWTRWDIHRVLESRWKELGPKLKGKLHLVAGGVDNFHLEEAVKLLCAFLAEKGSDATCEIVPGKGHFDLYGSPQTAPGGLLERIVKEMVARAGGAGKKP